MTNRMHNKIFVIDNQAALVGGRNIGDDYFGVAKKSNFRDLDLVTSGPIVGNISDAFDRYWNSPWAVPFEIFKTKIPTGKAMDKRYRKLKEGFLASEKTYPYPLDWRRETVHQNDSGRSRKTHLGRGGSGERCARQGMDKSQTRGKQIGNCSAPL